ncbi:response regulator transcription factor [Elizabethkingia anophelis]|uniref:response regulator transcription factor n=1 Tax=Elizabethkingia anophelis TaxID=1117645 RepID=UPI0011EAB369|nr:response regulator transcription factor [Elizabethkingia anophelis]MCT3773250.1 response regulator transcription factor [Elizabethkingia anophelis]MCT4181988.1 response regulator transcription factor [Elizabethkingia anophelis]MCT4272418.1 response regulator transcription factor [Elizabethkingia anophelis]MCT4289986.1 response regulator transcription factor [Elizabethkingia anophelis]TYT30081.1 response regulator transcription factor [Elizabethkingia anophelis]
MKSIIAVIDDHPVVTEGVRALLEGNNACKHILSFAKAEELLLYLNQNIIDIILLDIILPDQDGIDLCREIKKSAPQTLVIGFSNQAERSIILQLLQSGASGYLLKSATANELLNGIKQVKLGEIVFCSVMAKSQQFQEDNKRILPSVTRREKQLIQLLAEGKTTVAIADELFLSRFTIDTYRKNLLQKFKVKNTTELLMLLVQENLI